jgi:hypothetical protein
MSHHASRLVVVLTALALLAFAGTAAAQSPKVEVQGGATTLALDPGTAAALTDAGIAVKPIGDAKSTDDGIAFPVVGGWLTADPVGGRIHHLGGLRLRSDDTTVRLRNFVVRLDEDPDLLAKVGNGDERVSIADLDLSQAQVSLGGSRLQASGVTATLSADGAAALNAAFGLQLPAGLPIGTANVDADLEANDD